MLDKIKVIQNTIATALDIKPKAIVLGGSWALKLQDKLPNRNPHDIDFIIVKDVIKKDEAFAKLKKSFYRRPTSSTADSLGLTIFDESVCVFVANEEINVLDSEQDLFIQNWKDIVEIKREYARYKDVCDLLNMPDYAFEPYKIETIPSNKSNIIVQNVCHKDNLPEMKSFLEEKFKRFNGEVIYYKDFNLIQYVITRKVYEYKLI